MYYLEFIAPKPGVTQQDFQDTVRSTIDRWGAEHPEDEFVLCIGRTWRLGPQLPYILVWKIADARRLQDWDTEFRSRDIPADYGPFFEVASIVDAGLYEDLGQELW